MAENPNCLPLRWVQVKAPLYGVPSPIFISPIARINAQVQEIPRDGSYKFPVCMVPAPPISYSGSLLNIGGTIIDLCPIIAACEDLQMGPPGPSAYELAVSEGFVGTIEQWLVSLNGTDGTNGAAGSNGTNGANGLDGLDGGYEYRGTGGSHGQGLVNFFGSSLFVGTIDNDGEILTDYLATFDDSTSPVKGFMTFKSKDNPSDIAIFAITGTSTTGMGGLGAWREFPATQITATGLNVAENYMMFWARTGDKGEPGTNGTNGTNSDGGREILLAPLVLYVREDGDDLNDGSADTAGSAFATIGKAVETARLYDKSIFGVEINVGDGVSYGAITINDGDKTPTGYSILIQKTTPGPASGVECSSVLVENGSVKIVGITTSTVTAQYHAVLRLEECVTKHIIYALSFAVLEAYNHTFSRLVGTTPMVVCNQAKAIIWGSSAALLGTPTWSTHGLFCSNNGVLNFETPSGTAAGSRFKVELGGIIATDLGPAALLGTVAGTELTSGHCY